MDNTFTTRDLYLASALLTKGQSLVGSDTDKTIVYFIFANKQECLKLSHEYEFGKLLVNARDYRDQMSRLKNLVFS